MPNTERPINQEKRICVFLNHKGGVSKTTSVANIGDRLSALGYNVLLLDLDPQANLTNSFRIKEEPKYFMHQFFLEADSVKKTPVKITVIKDNLYIIPSNLQMATVDGIILPKTQREKILKKRLDKIVEKNIFDVILIDCPPNLGETNKNALVAAQTLIIPINAEAYPLMGFKMLEDEIADIRDGLNPGLEINRILISRFNKQSNLNKDIASYIEKNYNGKTFQTRIRNNIKVSEAQLAHMSIFDYSPGSPAAIDYAAVTEEFLDYLTK